MCKGFARRRSWLRGSSCEFDQHFSRSRRVIFICHHSLSSSLSSRFPDPPCVSCTSCSPRLWYASRSFSVLSILTSWCVTYSASDDNTDWLTSSSSINSLTWQFTCSLLHTFAICFVNEISLQTLSFLYFLCCRVASPALVTHFWATGFTSSSCLILSLSTQVSETSAFAAFSLESSRHQHSWGPTSNKKEEDAVREVSGILFLFTLFTHDDVFLHIIFLHTTWQATRTPCFGFGYTLFYPILTSFRPKRERKEKSPGSDSETGCKKRRQSIHVKIQATDCHLMSCSNTNSTGKTGSQLISLLHFVILCLLMINVYYILWLDGIFFRSAFYANHSIISFIFHNSVTLLRITCSGTPYIFV